jgi:hypothetical protein
MAPLPPSPSVGAAAAKAATVSAVVLRNGWDGLRRHIQADLASFRQWPALFVSNPILPEHHHQQGSSSSSSHPGGSSRRPAIIIGDDGPGSSSASDDLRRQQRLRDKRELSQISHEAQFLLQQPLGLRLLGAEQAFPFGSDHQIAHVRKLASRFSIGSSGNQGGGSGVVFGVGSGSCIDLARALAMATATSSSSWSSSSSSSSSGPWGPRLVLVPATHVSVMVSGGAAAASASSTTSASFVPCPPLALDSDEATLLPFGEGCRREASSVTVVQLEPSRMVGWTSTSALAASALVLDRILQASDRQRGMGTPVEARDEGEMRGLGELLDRLLRAASASADGPAGSSSDADENPPLLLWDALFDVGRTCLNFSHSSNNHGGSSSSSSSSSSSDDDALPYRPVPLALSASLAPVVSQSVPDLMAHTVPYLLSQVDGSVAAADVSSESRTRIERLLRDVSTHPPLDAPLDEYLSMLQINQSLSHCRDDDALLHQIVTDMVNE